MKDRAKGNKADAKAKREARLAEALRDNLRRRKQAARKPRARDDGNEAGAGEGGGSSKRG